MSFGLSDEDWVDPPEEPPVKCRNCDWWHPCQCGCGWGFCAKCADEEWTEGGDGC